MTVGIPLLPLSVRHLLALVLVVAGFFGLVAELRRHGAALERHKAPMFEVIDGKSSGGPMVLSLGDPVQFNWHQSAHEAVELMLLIYISAVGVAAAAFVVGRVVARTGRQPNPDDPASLAEGGG